MRQSKGRASSTHVKEITATVSSGHTHTHTLTLTYTLVCMKIQIKRNAVNNIKASVSCTKKKVASIMAKQGCSRTSTSVLAVTNEVQNVGVSKWT